MCSINFLILSMFSINVTFGQMVLDDFQNHDTGEVDITSNTFASNDALVNRIPLSQKFTFPSSNGPLRYESNASDTLESGLLGYNFYTKIPTSPGSYEVEQGIDLSTGGTINFTFSNISKPFIGAVALSDINENDKFIRMNFNPHKLTYSCNFLPQIRTADSFNIKKVESLVILLNYFDTNNSYVNDLTLDLNSIEVIPEPFSLLTIGSGITAFIRKRDKSKFNS